MPRRTMADPFHAAVGERIKARIDKMGITDEKAAELAGTPKGHLSNVLRGLVCGGLILYTKIGRALEMSLDDMVRDIPIKKPDTTGADK